MQQSASKPRHKPLALLVCAMGGEGGGVLTGWIVAAARAEGFAVQATSVPGVAQRTGGTTYYIEMAERDAAGRAPVFALTPVPGQIDVVLASELLEAARAARSGFATPDRTDVVTSTHRVFLIQEKMAMGDGRLDPDALTASVRDRARRATFMDMGEIARAAGVPISPVMLGALAGAGALPISRQHFETAIKEGGVAVERNLQAFQSGYEAALEAAGKSAAAPPLKASDFIVPTPASDIASLGAERLTRYQDRQYAELYARRLEPFAALGADLYREVARQLALRMSYEDVIRVAQLKAEPARIARIRAEVAAAGGEPVEVQDFFKPGVREIADILPPRLARRLLARAERSPKLGAWHVGMKLKTTTVLGYLRVYLLARMRPWRRSTHRFAEEQAAIESWLRLVETASRRGDTPLALEIVELARLVKGYGDTHRRGSANFARIVDTVIGPALGASAIPAETATLVREAREAALADPEGQSLARVLARAGSQTRAATSA